MPEIIRAKVEGLGELKQSLDALGSEVATKVGVTADRKAAQAFRDALRQAAPYDPREKLRGGKNLGHLRENIRIRRVRAQKQGHIVYWVTVGRAFWGMLLELGTKHMPARPWMLPAFEAARERLAAVQIEELRQGVEKAARRLAKIRRRG